MRSAPRTASSPFRVRPAVEEDLDRLVEIHACAYPDARTDAEREAFMRANPWGGLADVRVVCSGERRVALGCLFDGWMWLGSHRVPVGLIGSIAVAPEARRTGAARALLDALHAELDERRAVFSLLRAFRPSYYGPLGYGPTRPCLYVCVPSGELSRLATRHAAGSSGSLVAIDGASRAEVVRLHARRAACGSGWLDRDEARWDRLFADEHAHWVGWQEEGSGLSAYARFHYDSERADAPDLAIDEWVCESPRGAWALLGFAAGQRDQVSGVTLPLDPGHPLAGLLSSATGRRASGETPNVGSLLAGPMVRPVDMRRALECRSYARDGELLLAWGGGAVRERGRLVVRGGEARLSAGEPTVDSEPVDLELTRSALGSVLAGACTPTEAALLGAAGARSEEALRRADAMFEMPRFQWIDSF